MGMSGAEAVADQQERTIPAVAFLDKRPLNADFNRLSEKNAKVEVEIRNNRRRSQDIELRLVGLAGLTGDSDPALQKLARVGTVSIKVGSRKTATFVLPLEANESNRPKPGSYTGVLVASGSGDVVRRDFTIKVEEANGTERSKLAENPKPALRPKTIDEFSVQGTNYAPSLLSPLPGALFGLGVLLLIAAAIAGLGQFAAREVARDVGILVAALGIGTWAVLMFGRDGGHFDELSAVLGMAGLLSAAIGYGLEMNRRSSRLRLSPKSVRRRSLPVIALMLCGAGLTLAAAVMMLGRTSYTDAPSPRHIKTQSPRVADSLTGVVGALVAPDGTVANAEVENGRFKVKGLERADAYKGKIDLLPDQEDGETTATANVHDFWPYALIVIGIGVVIGYFVVNYFTRVRPIRKLLLRIVQIEETIKSQQSDFDDAAAGRPFTASLRIERRAREWLRRVRAKLADDDTKKAGEMLDSLEKYLDKFEALRSDSLKLDKLVSTVEKEVKKLSIGIEPNDMAALKRARALLAEQFDASDVDEEGTRLGAQAKKFEDVTTWLEALLAWTHMLSGFHGFDTSGPGWSKTLKDSYSDKAQDFAANQQDLLMAPSLEKATDNFASAVKAYNEMRSIAQKAARTPEELRKVKVTEKAHLATGADALAAGLEAVRRAQEIEKGTVHCRVVKAEEANVQVGTAAVPDATGGCAGDLNDRFAFWAELVVPAESLEVVYWDFGDGTRSAPLDVQANLPEIKHRFRQSGTFNVQLRTHSETVLDEVQVKVTGRSQVDVERQEFLQGDRQMTVVSGFLAIGSGLLTLYFQSSTWGSPNDYLEAFLWGSVVSEGVKQVAAIASRLGPPGETS
jgi:PKD domain-containing protein